MVISLRVGFYERQQKRLSETLKIEYPPTKRGKMGADKGLTSKFVLTPLTTVSFNHLSHSLRRSHFMVGGSL